MDGMDGMLFFWGMECGVVYAPCVSLRLPPPPFAAQKGEECLFELRLRFLGVNCWGEFWWLLRRLIRLLGFLLVRGLVGVRIRRCLRRCLRLLRWLRFRFVLGLRLRLVILWLSTGLATLA